MNGPDPFGELASVPWMADGLCAHVDPGLWFPDKGGDSRPAKRLCMTACPVQPECLTYALHHPDDLDGVWGGTTRRERHRIRTRRAAA